MLLRLIALGACSWAMLVILPCPASAQVDSETASKTDQAGHNTALINETVSTFFENWNKGKAKNSKALLVNSQSPIVILKYDPNSDQHVGSEPKPATTILAEWEAAPPRFLRVDEVKTEVLSDTFALSKAAFTGAGTTGKAIMAMSRESGDWKFASIAIETRFRW